MLWQSLPVSEIALSDKMQLPSPYAGGFQYQGGSFRTCSTNTRSAYLEVLLLLAIPRMYPDCKVCVNSSRSNCTEFATLPLLANVLRFLKNLLCVVLVWKVLFLPYYTKGVFLCKSKTEARSQDSYGILRCSICLQSGG